jgi:hypothetical protein
MRLETGDNEMPNHYNAETMSNEQIAKATRILHRDGWEYKEDRFYPATDGRRMGWWINTYGGEEYEQYRRPQGDPKSFAHATQNTYRLYSGHGDLELNH